MLDEVSTSGVSKGRLVSSLTRMKSVGVGLARRRDELKRDNLQAYASLLGSLHVFILLGLSGVLFLPLRHKRTVGEQEEAPGDSLFQL